MKFYICEHCGNIVTKLPSAGVPIQCCGEPMKLLEAGVTDAAVEKHVHWLQPGEAPEAVFALAEGQKAVAVYEYCNLHGLWKADV